MKPLTSILTSRSIMLLCSGVGIFLTLLTCKSISDTNNQNYSLADTQFSTSPLVTVTSDLPSDIYTNGTPASMATLTDAAIFAWNEFIALNWPAQSDTRDTPNTMLKFGSQGGDTPLVWHTFRAKVEIYPGDVSQKPAGYNDTLPDFGYSNTPPKYIYKPSKVGPKGMVSPYSGTPSTTTPWINLDEKNEIGVATMYAGVSEGAGYPDPQILYLAKANKQEYVYAAKHNWLAGGTTFKAAKKNTVKYIQQNGNTPPPGAGSNYVSLPYGTIEIKSAWRKLTATEASSGRFYKTQARYYREGAKSKMPEYVDEEFGMVALHIIHKTPTAPYFVFATFEQADNILTSSGTSVEDEDGNIVVSGITDPLTPEFTVTNATPTTVQTFNPTTASSTPGKSLYYKNADQPTSGLPTGTVTYNKRINPIPQEIIDVNKSAHAAIKAYNTANSIKTSPWDYYKLVNVQYKPMQKAAGVDYTGTDIASYYLSNSVVESDYVLQKFSGKFNSSSANAKQTITDYNGTSVIDVAYNAYYKGTKYLMGGCMGCHGNATNKGADYSFILGHPVGKPDYAEGVTMTEPRIQELMDFLNKE